MERADWRRRVHPTIAAAVPTRIVRTNYCRAEESNATDLRLHPVTRGHWALNVAYISGVVCHGELENDACQASDLYRPTRETARLRRSGVRAPYTLEVDPNLCQNTILHDQNTDSSTQDAQLFCITRQQRE